jgi:hypothetical protein
MPLPTEEEKERRRRLHANVRASSRGGPDLTPFFEAVNRVDRLLGLAGGTGAGAALQFMPGTAPVPAETMPWIPDVTQLPKAIGAFDEYRRRGDWDTGISAFHDAMDAGPGFWGIAEAATSAIAPTGGPALVGRGVIKALPKLAGTIAKVAPSPVRPGVQAGLRAGIRSVGEALQAPWELEEAAGRGLIRGLGWIAGKTVAGPGSKIRNLIDAAQRSGGREAGPGIRALPPGQQPQQLALPAGRTDLEPSPITGQQLDVGAGEVVVTFVTPENPAGSVWIIPYNNVTRRTFDELGEGVWGDVDVIEGASPQEAMEQWLVRHQPGEAAMRAEQRAFGLEQRAELSDIANRIDSLQNELDALKPPTRKTPGRKTKQRRYEERRARLQSELEELWSREDALRGRPLISEPEALVPEELLEGYPLGARERPLGDLDIFDPAAAFPRARRAFPEETVGRGAIEEVPPARVVTPTAAPDAPAAREAEVVPGTPADLTDSWQEASWRSDIHSRQPMVTGQAVSPGVAGVDDALESMGIWHRAIRWGKKLFDPNDATARRLLTRHEGAINVAQNEARDLVEKGNGLLRALGIGVIRQGRLTMRQQDIAQMDALFEALHNPSRVATGEVQVPAGLQGVYDDLRGLTNWTESMGVDFDPDMATVHDYFYRGWIGPKEAFEGVQVGPLGRKPSFQKPRVDATYREMRNAGFEPRSWNPYEQWRIRQMQDIRYSQQMQLIGDLKARGLAQTEADAHGIAEWHVPEVGPAFEGKPVKATNALGEEVVMHTQRYAVPNDVANLLENLYGRAPKASTLYLGANQIDLGKAIDWISFVPKRTKLFGSFFQQIDFETRNYIGSWAGMADALAAGHPLEAVMHLARWPNSAWKILNANFSPGARVKVRQELNSTDALIPNRPGIHFRGIMEAGLSTIDTTILPQDMDKIAQVVAEEAGLLGNKAVRRAILSLESSMRRGLFEGTYPVAQMVDIRNNIAPMIVRRYGKNLSDEALNEMIAKVANIKYSTIPATQSVLGNQPRMLRETLRRLFFSIGESEGLLRQVTGLAGPEGQYWVAHWAGAYMGLIALANAIHFASTGEALPVHRWVPLSRDKWGVLSIGYNPQFAAPDIPVRDIEGRRLTVDLVGQLDTALRILDPPSFLSARESVPVRAIQSQLSELDYFGRPIDRVGPGGIVSRTANLMNDLFTPIGPGQSAVQIALQTGVLPEGTIATTERRLGTAGQLLQAPGINIRALESWRTEASRAVDGFTMTIRGEESNYRDLPKHTWVREAAKRNVPSNLIDLVDEYIDADYSERNELERISSFRDHIIPAVRNESQPDGTLYLLRGEFFRDAPLAWKVTAARLGMNIPGSEDARKRMLEMEEKGEQIPEIDYDKWTIEPAGAR